ncbi:hypothetical protein R1sor_001758 [Riccia sorocarpa]|uniref:Uncharacterized protein n=1 Tax=Riccia sorocarpa TaxID=122646 RepID=A0ABD3GYH7_9MARC
MPQAHHTGSPSKSWGDIAEEEELEAAREEEERQAEQDKRMKEQEVPDSQQGNATEATDLAEKEVSPKGIQPSWDLNTTPRPTTTQDQRRREEQRLKKQERAERKKENRRKRQERYLQENLGKAQSDLSVSSEDNCSLGSNQSRRFWSSGRSGKYRNGASAADMATISKTGEDGDWNMVTDVRDSVGPTPMLSDLQAWRGDRLDQSRLDRIYANNNEEWLKSVWKVKHFGKEALSDHIPVLAELQIEGVESRGGSEKKRRSYTKLDVESLEKPEYLDRIRRAWEEGYSLSEDPILRWSFAWSRVQKEYKQIRGELHSKVSKLDTKKEKLEEIRIRLSEGAEFYDSIDMEEYSRLEGEVKEADLLQASIWRRRSRYKWLQLGEAPSSFFFKTMKAKHSAEKMDSLKLEDGTLLTQEDHILQTVKAYYKELYSKDETVERAREERARILALVEGVVTETENAKLAESPSTEEINKTVEELPKDKAPGKDWVTAEILRATWTWTRDACEALIEEFWKTKRLGLAEAEGVIRLLPKSQEKQLLAN